MRQAASRLRVVLALGVVLLPVLLAGATLAHTHDGAGIGLYNQEHDLVLMAALGSAAPLPAPVLAVAPLPAPLFVTPPAAVAPSPPPPPQGPPAPPPAFP